MAIAKEPMIQVKTDGVAVMERRAGDHRAMATRSNAERTATVEVI